MELHEIVMKLVGPVQPVGESNTDAQRLANLRNLTDLAEQLLTEIHLASMGAHRVEASMNAIGRHAKEFLENVGEAFHPCAPNE